MTIIAARRKNGSQVLMAAPQLTYFPGEIEYSIQTPVERLDRLTMDQHEESEGDHVPPGGAVILHAVESPGHVTVAVITA